jgi:methyl-accepting chemotaxis protein
MGKLGLKILRMVVIISIVSIAILIGLNAFIFNFEFNKLKLDAKNTAVQAITAIDGDKLDKVISSKSMDSNEYKEIQQAMIKFKNDKDIKFIYTLGKKDDNNAYFIVDSDLINTAEFGKSYMLLSEMKLAFQEQAAYTKKPVTDEYGTFISAYAPIKNSSGKVIAIVCVDKDVAQFINIKEKIFISVLAAGAIIIILSVVGSYLFSRKLSANVKKIRDALFKMSDGDLTVALKIYSKDEIQSIGEAINDFTSKFGKSVKIVKHESKSVMESSEALSAIAEELASSSEGVTLSVESSVMSTTAQVEELEIVNSVIEGFGHKLDETSNAIEEISSRIDSINAKAQVSDEDLTLLENAIKEIVVSFSDVSEKIRALGDKLSQINVITNLINSIADETNLLALNAAIEAARAGEAGRGFSVVADEIRKLAEQSKESSLNINSLVNAISGDSEYVIKSSDIMNEKLNKQTEIITKSVSSFKDIMIDIAETFPRIGKISENIIVIDEEKEKIMISAESVLQMAEEISANTEELSSSSQELSAASEEIAAASMSLTSKAQNMMNSAEKFKI